jgi:hypothetical protein
MTTDANPLATPEARAEAWRYTLLCAAVGVVAALVGVGVYLARGGVFDRTIAGLLAIAALSSLAFAALLTWLPRTIYQRKAPPGVVVCMYGSPTLGRGALWLTDKALVVYGGQRNVRGAMRETPLSFTEIRAVTFVETKSVLGRLWDRALGFPVRLTLDKKVVHHLHVPMPRAFVKALDEAIGRARRRPSSSSSASSSSSSSSFRSRSKSRSGSELSGSRKARGEAKKRAKIGQKKASSRTG